MPAANTADFLGSGGTLTSATAGLTELTKVQVEQRAKNAALAAANTKQAEADLAKRLADSKAAAAKGFAADQNAALKAITARSGGLVGDLKVIGKGVASAAGTAAKVAGTVAAVVPGGQVLGAGLIAAGTVATKLGKGDVSGALVSGVSAAAPAVGSAVQAAAPVAAAVKTVADTAATVKAALPSLPVQLSAGAVVDTLTKGGSVSASSVVPLVKSLAIEGASTEGLRVLADKVIAASGAGNAAASAIIAETTRLATGTNSAAARAGLAMLGEVSAARAKAGVAKGAEQAVSATGKAALATLLAGATGLRTTSLAPAVVIRSAVPAGAFVPSAGATAAVTKLAGSVALTPAEVSAAAKAAAAKPAAPLPPKAAPAPAPAAAPVVALPAPELGFIVTLAGRVLDGLSWREDASGAEGLLVRTTGPAALRRDAALRRWKRA